MKNVRSESIGSTLAEARRAAGLTVEQLSARTRIREPLIRAMERDDFSLCGGHFYARGHIRNIAKTVGLDPEAMVAAYEEAHGGRAAPMEAVPVFSATVPVKMRERRSAEWGTALGVALAVVIVFSVIRLMGGGGEQRVAEERPVQATAAARATEAAARDADASRKRGLVVVTVHARRPSHLRVQDAAGRRLFEGEIQAGTSSTWRARERVKLVIGDAGAVTLRVNGRDLGVAGRPGETVRRSFGPPARPAEAGSGAAGGDADAGHRGAPSAPGR